MDSFETHLNNSYNLEISLETLELLEWPTICSQLSTFAATEQVRRRGEMFDLPLF
jgi:DNA mismatch repair protein MutS2